MIYCIPVGSVVLKGGTILKQGPFFFFFFFFGGGG